MKIKTLVAAVALAAVTSGANAAIVEGNAQIDGELFLTVFDEAGQQSYALDLGFTVNQMTADSTSARSYDLTAIDSNFAGFAGNTNLRYTVTGMNTEAGSTRRGTTTQLGFMTTTSGTVEQIQAAAGIRADADGVIGNIQNMALNSNASAGPAYNGTNGGINLSNVALIGEIGYYGDASWGDTIGNRGIVASNTVDNAMTMYTVRQDGNDNTVPFLIDALGSWLLTSTGQLTYTNAPSAVPVPAAVWLFGSGLIGLAGIARRKKA